MKTQETRKFYFSRSSLLSSSHEVSGHMLETFATESDYKMRITEGLVGWEKRKRY